jgi:thioredoxin reductase (NADPH)
MYDEPAIRPAIVVIDDDPTALDTIERDLNQRFERDYRIVTAASPAEGIEILSSLATGGGPVALIAASLHMTETTGPELLDAGYILHRHAVRVLLIAPTSRGNVAAVDTLPELRHALALGRADRAIAKGWASPEEWFYPQIQSALSDWAAAHLPRREVVRVIGHRWDPATHDLRDALDRNVIPFGYYEAGAPEGQALLAAAGAAEASLPVVLFEQGFSLSQPAPRDVVEALGAGNQPGEAVYDVVILGAGPAGLAAAVNAASEGLHTLVIEPVALGGQAGSSSRIRNYLGFPQGASGRELTSRAYEQALLFGVNFLFMREAVALASENGHFLVHLAGCAPARARSVIVSIGVRYRRLGIPALERLVGAGVYYGSAAVEAPGMGGKPVFVVGGANSAGQAAVYLAGHAERVSMLVRGGSLEKDMSRYLIEQIRNTPNIDVLYRHQVVGARGERQLETLTLLNEATAAQREMEASAVFILIGAESCAGWLEGTLEMDQRGYILTGRDVSSSFWPLKRPPLAFETSLPGVFASGDARYRSMKRVAAAVGEGSVTIGSVRQYLAGEQ